MGITAGRVATYYLNAEGLWRSSFPWAVWICIIYKGPSTRLEVTNAAISRHCSWKFKLSMPLRVDSRFFMFEAPLEDGRFWSDDMIGELLWALEYFLLAPGLKSILRWREGSESAIAFPTSLRPDAAGLLEDPLGRKELREDSWMQQETKTPAVYVKWQLKFPIALPIAVQREIEQTTVLESNILLEATRQTKRIRNNRKKGLLIVWRKL